MSSKFFLISLIIALLITFGVYFDTDNKDESMFLIKIKETKLYVELADTPELQTRGLSDRIELADNAGMLFIHNKPDFYSFWMKDMKFPLDIIWINEAYVIVDISKDLKPDSYPKLFSSIKPAKYVLEVNSGWANENNVVIGDRVDNIDKLEK